jgi:mono/diheme cytochrome c family protein
LFVAGVIASASVHASPQSLAGWSRYEELCAACHGTDGDGRGPAAPFSRSEPRDFTHGAFAWRSTPFGAPPTDDDLRATIRFGVPATSMPGFSDTLDAAQVDELVAIVRAFAPPSSPQKPIVLGPPPAADPARGAALWTQLGCDKCHGTTAPDFAVTPQHRPRAHDSSDDRRRAAAWSIATGMTGTAMPGYAGQIANADLWALADRVVALGANATVNRMTMGRAKLEVGTWPGGNRDEASVFGAPIASQGAAPPSLAPAEASLSELQCARCHAKQAREWQPSLHAGATSPGFAARLADGADSGSCKRCHAPLAEQATDAALYAEGVQCAGCHVRNWTRRGPPNIAPSLAQLPSYPFTPSPLYERADLCMTCHQLPPSSALEGKPLLNTYKEWLEGPYMPRGIQCQSCHMPNREHQWLGIHDPTTFRQGIRLTADAHRAGDAIEITAELANVGAGHDLPTTPTPAVWLRLELLDGTRVVGSFAQRIGRDIYWDGAWHERSDTRIPPGESLRVTRQWQRVHATTARVTVEVHPDDYYEKLYAARLASLSAPLAPARALYESALRRANGSHYMAETREIALP